jgi:DNA-binding response OmpR family regulator
MTEQTIDYTGRLAILVDDDPDMLLQLQLQLEAMGFTVRTGVNQAEGEALIADSEPDLAVFDLMMDHQDSGFVLSYRMKKKSAATPVILVTNVSRETGYQFDAATSETRNWIKADVVLDKGIRAEQLRREINRLLEV